MSPHSQHSFKICFPVCGPQRVEFSRATFPISLLPVPSRLLPCSELRKPSGVRAFFPAPQAASCLSPPPHICSPVLAPAFLCPVLTAAPICCESLTEGLFPGCKLFHFQFARLPEPHFPQSCLHHPGGKRACSYPSEGYSPTLGAPRPGYPRLCSSHLGLGLLLSSLRMGGEGVDHLCTQLSTLPPS